MEEKVILTHEGVTQFENALSMLDTSLSELKKVADNMLPENLVNDGLRIYLPEFCRTVSNERNIKFNLNFNNEFDRLTEPMEAAVFRAIRSLIHYILKYAEATSINISIFLENKTLTVDITNNGKGFDMTSPNILGSKEMAHIKLWVEIMKGRFWIIPEHNKGNEVIIEFTL